MILRNTTTEVEEVILKTLEKGTKEKYMEIVPELLIETILEGDNIIRDIILDNEFNIDGLKNLLNATLTKVPKREEESTDITFSKEFEELIDYAYHRMGENQDKFLALDILMLSILNQNRVSKYFDSIMNRDDIVLDLITLRGDKKVMKKDFREQSFLTQYAINLTEKAKKVEVGEVYGRDEEIERVSNILTKRIKNNPVLIGEPGVGKTAIAEGLAHKINSGEIENLRGAELYEVDLTSICSCKDKAKARMQGVINEVKRKEKEGQKIILFIDEIHQVAASPAGLADVLKPALARGDVRTIGATTLKEYNKYFEKDMAFQRRFQKVLVEEPDEEQTLYILKKIRSRMEKYHKVVIQDSALISAVRLSKRYITDRRNPDKSIDLIDEASAQIANSRFNEPLDIKKLKQEIEALVFKKNVQQQAINSSDKEEFKAKQREVVENIESEISEKEKELGDMLVMFENNKKARHVYLDLKEELKKVKKLAFDSLVDGNHEDAVKYRDQEAELLVQLKEVQKEIIDIPVSEEFIKEVISKWTGIPTDELSDDDREKIKNIESLLKQRVQGQDEAIKTVSKAIRRNKAGLGDATKPIGSFMFLGPTGVGKTETAKALSEYLFGDEGMLFRLDMSEFQEAHTVSKLIGSPSGYVGHEEGGMLTNHVKNHPYSVILFDEVEKAHPRVFDVLLQVLDDGRLTDGKGITVDFKNTVIIFTSNIAGKGIPNIQNLEIRKQEAIKELQKVYRPEFLNRMDDIVVYNPLDEKAVFEIFENRIAKLADKLWEDRFVELVVTDVAKIEMVSSVDVSSFGARPINRLVASEIEDRVTDIILDGEAKPGTQIIIDFIDEEITSLVV